MAEEPLGLTSVTQAGRGRRAEGQRVLAPPSPVPQGRACVYADWPAVTWPPAAGSPWEGVVWAAELTQVVICHAGYFVVICFPNLL